MWARVASFEDGDVKRLRELQQERLAQGRGVPDGVKGALVFVDHETGRRQFVTLFESHEAIEAVEGQFDAIGDEIPEDIRGHRTAVNYYDVVYQQLP